MQAGVEGHPGWRGMGLAMADPCPPLPPPALAHVLPGIAQELTLEVYLYIYMHKLIIIGIQCSRFSL